MPIPDFATYYYLADSRPFSNLSAPELDSALASTHDPRTSVALRQLAEERLRRYYAAIGGQPERTTPHYFCLGRCAWFRSLAPDVREFAVPLSDLPPDQTTFTYPDSLVATAAVAEFGLPYDPRPYHGRLYHLDDLDRAVAQYGLPADDHTAGYTGYHRRPFEHYVELQVWTDSGLQTWLNGASVQGDREATVSAQAGERPPDLGTPRLMLRTLVRSEIDALVRGDVARASSLASASFPPGWPDHHPEAVDGLRWHLKRLTQDPAQLPWRVRALVERSSNRVVGAMNIKGPPDVDGEVEIGWGITRGARRLGYATEAGQALMAWLTQQVEVRLVSALIASDNVASQGVARNLGMIATGERYRGLARWVRAIGRD